MRHSIRAYVLAAAVGVVVGLITAAFLIGITHVQSAFETGVDLLRRALAIPIWLAAGLLGAAMLGLAAIVLRKGAPEAAGSGVHEVEAHLDGLVPLRWRRVLPVKFAGSLLTLGAHTALGPEGPAVHMGSAAGRLVADASTTGGEHAKALVCAGAGAGLSAIFGAPIAGVVFVLEQMRRHFALTATSFHCVVIACWVAAFVAALFFGQAPAFPLHRFRSPALLDLMLFVAMGAWIGAFGAVFNFVLLATLDAADKIRSRAPHLLAPLLGAATGVLFERFPDAVGSGQALALSIINNASGWQALAGLLLLRIATAIGSYATAVPGGLFAPLLALGATLGMLAGHVVAAALPDTVCEPQVYALAAMGALFAATFRLPLTAIVLVIEITHSANVTLAIVGSCLAASVTADALRTRPLYETLLARLCTRQQADGAMRSDRQRRPTTTSPTNEL